RAYISDDELLLVRAYDLSLVPEGVIDGSSAAKDIFFSTLSRLFFDGFTASVVEGHDKCPGFVAWGKAPPGALKIVEETTEKNGWKISKGSLEGLDYDLEILSIVDPKDVDKELMAVAVKGNTLFVGESEDTLAALIDRAEGGGSGGTIKMALLSRLKGGEEGISLKAKPAPLWESMEECPSAFEMLSASLFPSSKENSLFRSREFVRGLYPVKELAVDIRPAAGGVTAEIIIDIDAKMNEE
ncbi:MAG: hypothetical protein P8Y09_10210, partial [Deltaproteobacteria bacterium]